MLTAILKNKHDEIPLIIIIISIMNLPTLNSVSFIFHKYTENLQVKNVNNRK